MSENSNYRGSQENEDDRIGESVISLIKTFYSFQLRSKQIFIIIQKYIFMVLQIFKYIVSNTYSIENLRNCALLNIEIIFLLL